MKVNKNKTTIVIIKKSDLTNLPDKYGSMEATGSYVVAHFSAKLLGFNVN